MDQQIFEKLKEHIFNENEWANGLPPVYYWPESVPSGRYKNHDYFPKSREFVSAGNVPKKNEFQRKPKQKIEEGAGKMA